MAHWGWGLAIPPTGSAKGPVPPGGPFSTLSTARARRLTVRCDPDQDDEAVFTLNGRGDEAALIDELATDLVVMRDSDVLFRGRIGPAVDTLDDRRHDAQFTAWSYRTLLRHRNLMNATTLSFSGVEQYTIISNLLSYAQGQPGGYLGLTMGAYTGTGILRTVTYVKGDFIGDRISDLAKMDSGFDWQVTPYAISDLRLDVWYPVLANNRGVTIEYGGDLAQAITRTVDPSSYENAAYVTGDSTVSLTPQTPAASGIATAPEGRWEASIGTTLLTQAALNSRASWYQQYGQIITPTYQVVLRKGAWKGPDHIWPGDIVRLRIDSGRLAVNTGVRAAIDTDIRVNQMDIMPGESGDEQVTVTLGKLPLPIHRWVGSMLTRLSALERR